MATPITIQDMNFQGRHLTGETAGSNALKCRCTIKMFMIAQDLPVHGGKPPHRL